jgi:hypothetical protein
MILPELKPGIYLVKIITDGSVTKQKSIVT